MYVKKVIRFNSLDKKANKMRYRKKELAYESMKESLTLESDTHTRYKSTLISIKVNVTNISKHATFDHETRMPLGQNES